MLTESMKKRIDAMSYSEMFSQRRFAPSGSPLFAGETGDYFLKVMAEKEEKLQPGEKSAMSKRMGWG